jgi:hypothetical protein
MMMTIIIGNGDDDRRRRDGVALHLQDDEDKPELN